jgi:hypothetical protein
VTLANVRREFPHDFRMVVREPGGLPNRPRDLHPAFYGCFDWHSCVEMHWLLVWRRLAESLPADDPRVPVMLATAAAHAEPELEKASGTDYMVEHWLACYAVLYLS